MFFLCFLGVGGLWPRVLWGTAWASWLRLCLDMPSCGYLWLPVACWGRLWQAVAGCSWPGLLLPAAGGSGRLWLALWACGCMVCCCGCDRLDLLVAGGGWLRLAVAGFV